MREILLALTVLCFACGAAAQTPPADPPDAVDTSPLAVSAAEQDVLDRAIARGRLMYAFDQAAWHSTDRMREDVPRRTQEVRGWIVEADGDRQTVTYFGLEEDKPYRVYVAEMRTSQVVSAREIKSPEDRVMTPMQVKMAEATRAARSIQVGLCARAPPNVLLVPPASLEADIEVYILTPQVLSLDIYPMGGHTRLVIGPDNALKSQSAFTRSCLDIPMTDAVGAMVTEIVTEMPTEIHVWVSLWSGRPVHVATGSGLWAVEGLRITRLSGPLTEEAPAEAHGEI